MVGIGLDLDNMLVPFNETALKGYVALSSSDLSCHFGSEKECVRKLNEFYETDTFRDMMPYPGAIEFVKRLTEHYRVPIVTSRPKEETEKTTLHHVEKFFPTISDLYFANKNNNKGSLTKHAYVEKYGLLGFVDDDKDVCKEVFWLGRIPVLFEQLWNNNEHYPFLRTNDYNKIISHYTRITEC
jgi:5'(3')-deoxyribonucleotidase